MLHLQDAADGRAQLGAHALQERAGLLAGGVVARDSVTHATLAEVGGDARDRDGDQCGFRRPVLTQRSRDLALDQFGDPELTLGHKT